MKDLVAAIMAQHPEHTQTLQAISAISDVVNSLPFEPFFEPLSAVLMFPPGRNRPEGAGMNGSSSQLAPARSQPGLTTWHTLAVLGCGASRFRSCERFMMAI